MRHRRRRRTKVQRVVRFVKAFIAFLFSHVGLCAVVIGYAMLGAFMFKAIESEFEFDVQRRVQRDRNASVDLTWQRTYNINRLDERRFKADIRAQVAHFQALLLKEIKLGYDAKEYGVTSQWTFTGAFLYSLTVITTIGYGNTACKTSIGKCVTILYAIIGIPLMLLFLTNIGDVLAKTFKFLYSRSVKAKMRLVLWQKRRQQTQLRQATSLVTRMSRHQQQSQRGAVGHHAAHHAQYGVHGEYSAPGQAVPDFEQLIRAREELARLEAKLQVEDQLHNVTVPLTLVILTMIAYLLFGATLFSVWEGWTILEGLYFCWISLSTIGFGDLFPGAAVSDGANANERLVITSAYLMLGMALIAMCFNLAQEEVINKVTWMMNKFGFRKKHEQQQQIPTVQTTQSFETTA